MYLLLHFQLFLLAHDSLHRLSLLAVVAAWLADAAVLVFLVVAKVSGVVLVMPIAMVELEVLVRLAVEEVVAKVFCNPLYL